MSPDEIEIEEAADELHPSIPWIEAAKARRFSGTPGKLVGEPSEWEWMARQYEIDARRFIYEIN